MPEWGVWGPLGGTCRLLPLGHLFHFYRLLQSCNDDSLNVALPMRMLEVFSSEDTYLPVLQDASYVVSVIEQILHYMIQNGELVVSELRVALLWAVGSGQGTFQGRDRESAAGMGPLWVTDSSISPLLYPPQNWEMHLISNLPCCLKVKETSHPKCRYRGLLCWAGLPWLNLAAWVLGAGRLQHSDMLTHLERACPGNQVVQ